MFKHFIPTIFLHSLCFFFLHLIRWKISSLICRRFRMWTVARLSGDKSSIVLQGPICNGSQVIGWHENESDENSKRFHAEMSGFAFNSTILWDPKKWHRATLEPIRQLDSVEESLWVSNLVHLSLCYLISEIMCGSTLFYMGSKSLSPLGVLPCISF